MSRTRFRKLLPLVSTLVLMLPLLLALAAPVSAATVTVCASGCDYTSITAAVTGETYPVIINAYPDTYDESVDLYKASGGNITLRTVNAAGTPTPGTATVNGGGSQAFRTSSVHTGNVTIDGFIVKSTNDDGIYVAVNSDVVIRNVIANGTGHCGIDVYGASGNVTVEDCTANENSYHGFDLDDIDGNLTVTRCTANDNDDENFDIDNIGGNVTITNSTANRSDEDEGFDIANIGGNVKVTGCTANDNEDENFEIDEADGNVTIRRCTANGSKTDEGIRIGEEQNGGGIGGNVEITDCTANDNDQDGIRVEDVGEVNGFSSRGADEEPDVEEQDLDDDNNGVENTGATVRPSANGGNVTISNCTTNGNGLDDGEDGIYVNEIAGDLLISNCTAIGNGQDGFDPQNVEGDVTITASVVRLTVDQEGVDLDELEDADLILVNGNIICDHQDGLQSDETTNAEANWWGCTTGPNTSGCDSVIGDGPVDYTPWIDTVTASAPASVIVGQPAIVSFQFSGGPPAVYLGEGPGDLHGDPTFVVSTDNGSVTGGFINAPHGVMEVTLVPQTEGTATVTVVGPCGLDEQIVLGVQAAAADFVPEPGSVVLLASGLMGLAGYAGLRMRKK